MKNEPSKLALLADLVLDNEWAAGFQTLGQYRVALAKEIARLHNLPNRLVSDPSSCYSGCCIARQVMPSAGGGL